MTVKPAVGACWVGTEVGVEALMDHERDDAQVEIPGHYALVRCWRPGRARVREGAVYLVLRRFITLS